MPTLNVDFLDNTTENVVYDIDSISASLLPDFLTNGSSVFTPTVRGIITDLTLLVDPDTVYNPTVVGRPQPDFLVNSSSVYFPKISHSVIVVDPDFLVNISTAFDTDPNVEMAVPFLVNESVVFDAIPVYPRTFSVDFIPSTSKVNKPIVKQQPVLEVPVAPDEIVRSAGTLPKGERLTTGVNKVFKDLGIMFRPHPLTGDVTRVFDYAAITQSIKTIVLSEFYERPYSSQDTAGSLKSRLFELGGTATVNDIKEELALTIVRNEPRVIVQAIDVNELPGSNSIEISVQYKVKTFDTSERFTHILERA